MSTPEKTSIEMPVDPILLAPGYHSQHDAEVLKAIGTMHIQIARTSGLAKINTDFAVPPLVAARQKKGGVIGEFMSRVEDKIGGRVKRIRISENPWDSIIGANLRSYSLQPSTLDGDIDLSEVMDEDDAAPTVGVNARAENTRSPVRSALVAFRPRRGITEHLVDVNGEFRAQTRWAVEDLDCLEPSNFFSGDEKGIYIRDDHVVVVQCDITDEQLLAKSGITHRYLENASRLQDQIYFCRFLKSKGKAL